MNRRAFLASTGAVSSAFVAGCSDEVGRTEYEECPQTVILGENLPDEADKEVTTALEDGSYETDGDLHLAELMDPNSSYVRIDPEDPDGPPWTRIYYRPVIESGNGTTRLTLEEAIPTVPGSISATNALDGDVTVSITVEWEPYSDSFDEEVLVDDDFEIAAERSATLISGEFRYGKYSAAVDFHSGKDVGEAGWGLRTGNRLPTLRLITSRTGEKRAEARQAVSDMRYCEWNGAGEVTY